MQQTMNRHLGLETLNMTCSFYQKWTGILSPKASLEPNVLSTHPTAMFTSVETILPYEPMAVLELILIYLIIVKTYIWIME